METLIATSTLTATSFLWKVIRGGCVVATVVASGAAVYYYHRLRGSKDIKTLLLVDWYELARKLHYPSSALFKYQMAISHRQLERTSPSKILKEVLERKRVPVCTIGSSSVLDFYLKAYTDVDYQGITSSTLAQGQGKTVTCLQALSIIEERYSNDRVCNGSKAVFLFVPVGERGSSIKEALRRTLKIQDGMYMDEVLSHLCDGEGGGYTIFGLIDQLEQWQFDDIPILKALYQQQYQALWVHVPTAMSDIAEEFQFLNGGRWKCKCLGDVTKNLRHELSEDQATEFVERLVVDKSPEIQQAVVNLVRQDREKRGFVSSRGVVKAFHRVLFEQ